VTDKRSEFGSYDGVTIVEIVTEKFDTIKEYKDYALAIKFKLLYENFSKWDKYSDIMFVNSNLRFVKETDLTFFYDGFGENNRIVGTTHFMTRESDDYIQASFWISQSGFLHDVLCPYIQRQLDIDNENGVVAEWHDETYYNRIYSQSKGLWHLVDGYSRFKLIDKATLIGKEWDMHYNDQLFKLDKKTHDIFDVEITKNAVKNISVLKDKHADGFIKFKIYDIKNKCVVTDNKLIPSDDMYFYHLPGEFISYEDVVRILNKNKKTSFKKYLIYAKKD
jgi:hypothetical protein